jgi:hypothetical protein
MQISEKAFHINPKFLNHIYHLSIRMNEDNLRMRMIKNNFKNILKQTSYNQCSKQIKNLSNLILLFSFRINILKF